MINGESEIIKSHEWLIVEVSGSEWSTVDISGL